MKQIEPSRIGINKNKSNNKNLPGTFDQVRCFGANATRRAGHFKKNAQIPRSASLVRTPVSSTLLKLAPGQLLRYITPGFVS